MEAMTTPLAELSTPIAAALERIGAGCELAVELERPADSSHGDYATSVALRSAPRLRRSPREIAEALRQELAADERFETVEVAGPGFLNVRASAAWYRAALSAIGVAGASYGAGSAELPERVLVELVSANPTGALTVGSGRNGAYGDSVARLLAFAGHRVTREYYFNDAGGQIERLGASLRARALGREVPEDGYPGAEITEVAATLAVDADADDLTWARAAIPTLMERIRASLERLRIGIDIWFSERELHSADAVSSAIERARAGGHVYESEDAIWLRTTAFGDDKDRVLLKSDGAPTYFAADLAYVDYKFERGADRLIYVLGADHHGYVARLKAAAAVLGRDPEQVDVLIYQMMTVSGERMGKRRGNVVTVDEMLDEIGVDAFRYYLVQRSHDQTIDLDVDLAVEQSSTNPVYYVQYAHARIVSILRKAEEAGVEAVAFEGWTHDPEPGERALIRKLVEWPDVVSEATARRAPHRIVAWAHELAAAFHQFHHDHYVLHEDPDVRSFRLALCDATRAAVARALDLIGVEAPEHM